MQPKTNLFTFDKFVLFKVINKQPEVVPAKKRVNKKILNSLPSFHEEVKKSVKLFHSIFRYVKKYTTVTSSVFLTCTKESLQLTYGFRKYLKFN